VSSVRSPQICVLYQNAVLLYTMLYTIAQVAGPLLSHLTWPLLKLLVLYGDSHTVQSYRLGLLQGNSAPLWHFQPASENPIKLAGCSVGQMMDSFNSQRLQPCQYASRPAIRAELAVSLQCHLIKCIVNTVWITACMIILPHIWHFRKLAVHQICYLQNSPFISSGCNHR